MNSQIEHCGGVRLSSTQINSLYDNYVATIGDPVRHVDAYQALIFGIYVTVCGFALATEDVADAQQIAQEVTFNIERTFPDCKNPITKVEKPKQSNARTPGRPGHEQHTAWKRWKSHECLKSFSSGHIKKDGKVTDAGFYGVLAVMAKTMSLKYNLKRNRPHLSALQLGDAEEMGVTIESEVDFNEGGAE